MRDLLEEKNTYMNYYKQEEVKQREKECEHTKSRVKLHKVYINSLHMIKQREIQTLIIVKNANMKANGANIDKREKWLNKNWELQSPRKNI